MAQIASKLSMIRDNEFLAKAFAAYNKNNENNSNNSQLVIGDDMALNYNIGYTSAATANMEDIVGGQYNNQTNEREGGGGQATAVAVDPYGFFFHDEHVDGMIVQEKIRDYGDFKLLRPGDHNNSTQLDISGASPLEGGPSPLEGEEGGGSTKSASEAGGTGGAVSGTSGFTDNKSIDWWGVKEPEGWLVNSVGLKKWMMEGVKE